jgi:hypothetical protein
MAAADDAAANLESGVWTLDHIDCTYIDATNGF